MTHGSFAQRTLANALVIEVLGEIDIANVGQFVDMIEHAAEAAPSIVVVSFEHATYIDSVTINALLEHAAKLRAHGIRFAVAAPHDNRCSRIFRLVGMDRLLPVAASVSEAVGV